ncbi:helix-turn-helix domain-containing protein [Streptomyces sp. NPDC053048]|uniref:MmyB family transcriptional regulator n=1 Tax=Streptomyces sp. NPDC053048 TaxID=3365694 RepID=UPI0037D43B84
MNRSALGALLREARSLISPEDAGLSRTTRRARRSDGLSQTDMDQLLYRSQGTYQRLESGRTPNPSAALLEDVARILRLNQRSWELLWQFAADAHPPYPILQSSGREIPPAWRDVMQDINCMAYVNDQSWNVITHNEAWAAMFPRREPPTNTMRWMLLDKEARTHVLTRWETHWAPVVIAQLKAALGAQDDPVLAEIERDVLADPEVRPLYERIPAHGTSIDGNQRPLRHSVHGDMWVTILSAEPSHARGAQLVMLVRSSAPTLGQPAMLRARAQVKPNPANMT